MIRQRERSFYWLSFVKLKCIVVEHVAGLALSNPSLCGFDSVLDPISEVLHSSVHSGYLASSASNAIWDDSNLEVEEVAVDVDGEHQRSALEEIKGKVLSYEMFLAPSERETYAVTLRWVEGEEKWKICLVNSTTCYKLDDVSHLTRIYNHWWMRGCWGKKLAKKINSNCQRHVSSIRFYLFHWNHKKFKVSEQLWLRFSVNSPLSVASAHHCIVELLLVDELPDCLVICATLVISQNWKLKLLQDVRWLSTFLRSSCYEMFLS